MPLAGYVVAYVGLGVFLVAVAARIAMWARMPMHLRWELYPVPHEAERFAHGGSYLEETEWWKKPRQVSLAGELKVMVPEILFLVALREHNPRLWLRSFPFHFGLYLVIGCTMLMGGAGLLGALWPSLLAGPFGSLLRLAIAACGYAGLALGLLGALGLLERRLVAKELRDFTSPVDVLNLVFFVAALGCALATALLVDRDFARVSGIVSSLVRLQMAEAAGSLASPQVLMPTLSAVLLGALVAYIPLTHMSHFIGKYFAYHSIRWNDAPNLRNGDQEQAIQAQLGRKVSWAASHIQGGGTKTWGEVATTLPAKTDGGAKK
jgi:nitrate reductase gamma subunit